MRASAVARRSSRGAWKPVPKHHSALSARAGANSATNRDAELPTVPPVRRIRDARSNRRSGLWPLRYGCRGHCEYGRDRESAALGACGSVVRQCADERRITLCQLRSRDLSLRRSNPRSTRRERSCIAGGSDPQRRSDPRHRHRSTANALNAVRFTAPRVPRRRGQPSFALPLFPDLLAPHRRARCCLRLAECAFPLEAPAGARAPRLQHSLETG